MSTINVETLYSKDGPEDLRVAGPDGEGLTIASNVANANKFSLCWKPRSSGMVNLKIVMEQSVDGVNFFPPKNTFAVEVKDQEWDGSEIHPISFPYLRFRVIGDTGNSKNTSIHLYLSKKH